MLPFVAAAPWIIRSHGYGFFIPAVASSGVADHRCRVARGPHRGALGAGDHVGPRPRDAAPAGERGTIFSTDLYRYIWDGRVQAAGINPYLYVPADAALASLRDASIFPHINRADYAVTAYPPVAQFVFLAITRISETPSAMRLAMMGFEIVAIVIVIDLLRRLDLPKTAIVAFAWHPLAIWEIANNGHAEAAMVALMMLGVWLLVRARRVAGAVAVTCAALVKPYAVLVLPAFWRPWDWRVPAAILVTAIVCYAPYLGAGRGVLGFLTSYVSEEGLASGSGIWLVALAQSLFGGTPGLAVAYVVSRCGHHDRARPSQQLRFATHARRDNQRRYSVADCRAGADVPELRLVFSRACAVHSTRCRRAGLGADPWGIPALPADLPATQRLVWKTLATLPFVVALAVALLRRRRSGPS